MEAELRKEVKGIKGVGETGADIFIRRVQSCSGWDGIFPFIDGKTKKALREVGFSNSAEELKELTGSKGDFVVVLERVLDVSLEGKIKELKKANE